ncbi:MAG: hypothetical protein KIS79_03995 [Burkholderiales bacterium]|nr:hypothetical protein [Burkholderiales bacterium]
MKLRHGVAVLVALVGLALPARAQQDEEVMRAAISVIALDLSTDAMISHCEQAAPASAAKLRTAWRRWREEALVSQASDVLGAERLARTREGIAKVATDAVDKFKQMGSAANTCPQIEGWLGAGLYDTRTSFPALYARLGAQRRAAPPPEVSTSPAAKPDTDVATTTAGGLDPAQIHGLLYHGYGEIGVNGYEYREVTLLLLKDGSYYRGTEPAPEQLDVAKSRRAQPQRWGRWRAKGSGYQILPDGASGQWRDQAGRLIPAWKSGQRLAATYKHQAFHGNAASGGTFNATSYRFLPDGRFEILRYVQSGSGSVASATSGVASSSAGHSDGTGTQASAGGVGPGVAVNTSSRKDDGASYRGSYRLSGYSLELRFDDGRKQTLLSAPWAVDLEDIYISGRTFTRQ